MNDAGEQADALAEHVEVPDAERCRFTPAESRVGEEFDDELLCGVGGGRGEGGDLRVCEVAGWFPSFRGEGDAGGGVAGYRVLAHGDREDAG